MRILVTGGAGFIGSHYVRTLAEGGYPEFSGAEITVLDKLTYAGNPANLPPALRDTARTAGSRLIRGDIADEALVDSVMRGQDAVVHFAAESHVDRSIDGGAAFVRTNVLGTQVLLEAAVRHGVGRFVHVSTDEVYGSIGSGSWDEACALDPSSPYSAAKASSDLLALAYHRTHGLDVRVTRCSNNYGPHQHPEKAVPLFITNLLDGLPIPLYGDGGNVRDWLHVDDHCRGIQAVAERGRAGQVYNIGGGTELTNLELVDRILELCGRGWDAVERVADRKGHDHRYSVDDTRIREELGYDPAFDLGSGLTGVVDWYKNHREWWEPLKAARIGERPRKKIR